MQKFNLLAIDLEPAPYKFDLWNEFQNSNNFELFTIFSEKRNWSPDAGHDYRLWPPSIFKYEICVGQTIFDVIGCCLKIAARLIFFRPSAAVIMGYEKPQTAFAFILCILLRIRFFVHVDVLNIDPPLGDKLFAKQCGRFVLRLLVFNFAERLLVCGKRGIHAAELAGCKSNKICNFPYVIDVSRLREDYPKDLPKLCSSDLEDGKLILFFSGRMIERKGLSTLLNAVRKNKQILGNFVLWIEGDGPELERFKRLTSELKLEEECRFLGFCQFELHSWLIRSSHFVVVPSLQDNWGIVVDEALQLGKVVLSTHATGSANERIQHEFNGLIFSEGDENELGFHLQRLAADRSFRSRLSKNAIDNYNLVTPVDNVQSIYKAMVQAVAGD